MTPRHTSISTNGYAQLQTAVIEQFIPRFALSAKLLYTREYNNRPIIFDQATLNRLGMPADKQRKLPDIVLYLPRRKSLYLIELRAPVSARRRNEIERLLETCSAKRTYVSAFSDWSAYGRYGGNVAWKTEVWIAELPEHMIHYDGERLLNPHRWNSK